MRATEEAIQKAARALYVSDCINNVGEPPDDETPGLYFVAAEDMLSAAAPAIRLDTRETIAKEIDARVDEVLSWMGGLSVHRLDYERAAAKLDELRDLAARVRKGAT